MVVVGFSSTNSNISNIEYAEEVKRVCDLFAMQSLQLAGELHIAAAHTQRTHR